MFTKQLPECELPDTLMLEYCFVLRTYAPAWDMPRGQIIHPEDPDRAILTSDTWYRWMLNLIQSPQQAMDFKIAINGTRGSFNSETCRFQQHKFTLMEQGKKKKTTQNHLKELKYIYIERQ